MRPYRRIRRREARRPRTVAVRYGAAHSGRPTRWGGRRAATFGEQPAAVYGCLDGVSSVNHSDARRDTGRLPLVQLRYRPHPSATCSRLAARLPRRSGDRAIWWQVRTCHRPRSRRTERSELPRRHFIFLSGRCLGAEPAADLESFPPLHCPNPAATALASPRPAPQSRPASGAAAPRWRRR